MGRSYTVGSLFAGVGGFDLGFERAGFRCAWQVELNEFCRRVLAKHWPDVRRHDDVRTFPPSDPGEWRVDVVVGGDPCQQNSNAGSVHRRRDGTDIGAEFVRVVAALRPRVVLRENPSVQAPDAVRPWHRTRADFESLGYRVLPFRLRSCCLGADHRRDRLFLLAALPDPDRDGLEGFDWFGVAGGDAGGTARGPVRDDRGDDLPPPRVCRGADGVPGRVDRLRAIGNAVDPRVAEWIARRVLTALTEGAAE